MDVVGVLKGYILFLRQLRFMGWGILVLESKLQGKSLLRGVDVKKMGTTWIITEQALVRNFGVDKLLEYKQQNNVLNNE